MGCISVRLQQSVMASTVTVHVMFMPRSRHPKCLPWWGPACSKDDGTEWVNVCCQHPPCSSRVTLVQVPEGVTDEEAILLGDILSTAFFCVDQGCVSQGDVVVVLGCGPVGLLAVLAARQRGAAQASVQCWGCTIIA